jgi:beta-glucosidase
MAGASGAMSARDQAEIASHAAAAKATNSARFITMNYPDIDGMTPLLIAGHEQGYAAIKAERSNLPTGVTLNILDFEPATEDSPYEEVRKMAYGDWLEASRRTGDFTGAQIYRQIPIPGKGKPLPQPKPLPFLEGEKSMLASVSRPETVANGLEYVYAQTNKPIMLSENGIDTNNDERRIWYIDAALESLHSAIVKGIPVLGYMHWSLMDNFEWEQGFKTKYGLCSVDLLLVA